MSVQMILTEFIVAVTLGTITEYQIIPILLRSSAYRTFMLAARRIGCRLDIFPVGISAVNLLWIHALHITCSEIEQNKIQY